MITEEIQGHPHANTATVVPLFNRVVPDETLRAWTVDAGHYTRNVLFEMKQFVTDHELLFLGKIEQLVRSHLGIDSVKEAQWFWEEKNGMEEVRMAFRRKRQTANTAIQKGFKGKAF